MVAIILIAINCFYKQLHYFNKQGSKNNIEGDLQMKVIKSFIIILIITTLSGCAAVNTSIAKRNLDVQTKISTAIFVDAVKRSKRFVYVDIRSGVMEFDRRALRKAVFDEFAANDNGYRVVDDPEKAQYHMNIFVTKLEKTSPTAAELARNSGYGGDLAAGAVMGASVGSNRGSSSSTTIGMGLLGAIGVTAANAFVQDVTFLLIADVQIKEKARKGVLVRKDSKISTKVSDAGSSTQRVSEVSNRKEYRTRIVTTANKANLELAEAQELMFKKTAYAMSGFF